MKNLKKLITVCLVLTFTCLVILAGCGGNKAAETKPAETQAAETKKEETTVQKTALKKQYRIFNNYCMKGVEVCEEWAFASKKAGNELGITVDVNAADDAAVEKNIAMIEQAIAQKYDAIVTIPYAEDAFGVVIQKAWDAGIPVFAYHVDAPKSKRIAYFGPDQKDYATVAAKFVADKVGKKGKIITVQGSAADAESFVIDTFSKQIEAYAPDCKVAMKISDTIDPAKSYEKITAAIQANKDVVGFFSSTMRGGEDISKVCDEQGIKNPIIVAMDAVSSNLKLLKEGKATGFVDQGSLKTAYLAVYAAVDYLENGGKLTKYKEGPNLLPTIIVSKDNMADYEKEVNEVAASIKK